MRVALLRRHTSTNGTVYQLRLGSRDPKPWKFVHPMSHHRGNLQLRRIRVGSLQHGSYHIVAARQSLTMRRTACLLAVGAVLLALSGTAAQSAYQAVVSGEPTAERC